ncbi:MAG: choice-of-anchor D domain-containing protein, partial [Chthoniobacterales bacterium]
DGFSEKLDAAFGTPTGNATASGAVSLLGPGSSDNSSLIVGLNTSAAGTRSGSVPLNLTSNGSGTSGLGTTTLTSQTVNVSGNVYRLASASTHTPEPVAFGIVHIGDTPSQALSISNTAVNDAFSEKLDGSIAASTGGVTASGSFSLLAPGAPANTSLSVGIDTATAGNKNGTATISLVSDGTGTSGLTNTNLTSQTVNVTGQVNFFADPVVIFKSGSATVTMNSPTSFTINFGSVQPNSGTYLASFGVNNSLHNSTFQDSLGGTWNLAMVSNFGTSGFGAFSGIAPGSSLDPNVSFDSSQGIGSYSNQILLDGTSSNASGTSNLNEIQLNLVAQIIPEPNTWAMLLGGGGMLIVLRRFLRRRN